MTPPTVYRVRHLCATNTPSGTPRRVYVGYDEDSTLVTIADERFDGTNCARWVKNAWLFDIIAPDESITVADYRLYVSMIDTLTADRIEPNVGRKYGG